MKNNLAAAKLTATAAAAAASALCGIGGAVLRVGAYVTLLGNYEQ